MIADLASVKIKFGGAIVNPLYAGMTYAGVFQINVKVPSGAPGGDVLFSIQIGSDVSQPKTYITVQP